MSDSTIVVCPSCDAKNNLPQGKPGEQAKCGKCKKEIFPDHPVDLKGDSFFRHIQETEIPTLVDFWADWCGPCKMMAPVFAEANRKLRPRVRFAKVNTEQETDISRKYGIRSIPTMILFQGGQEKARMSGAMDLAQISNWLREQGVEIF